jgi:hypothetical protein
LCVGTTSGPGKGSIAKYSNVIPVRPGSEVIDLERRLTGIVMQAGKEVSSKLSSL